MPAKPGIVLKLEKINAIKGSCQLGSVKVVYEYS